MSYKLAIIQNYDPNEHYILSQNNLPGFFSTKKILYEVYSNLDSVKEFTDQFYMVMYYRRFNSYRLDNPLANEPYLALIHMYKYNDMDFLRNKTYLIITLQRKFREYLLKKKRILTSPIGLRYREIHGRYPTYYQFYNNMIH
mgnify:CR=1 FL=1